MSTSFVAGAVPAFVFVIKATLVLAAAFVATTMLRRTTAGERHLVWLAALVGVLALPALSKIPALRLGILPSELNVAAPSGGVVAPGIVGAPHAPVIARIVSVAAPVGSTIRRSASSPRSSAIAVMPSADINPFAGSISIFQMLASVWVIVAASLGVWLILGAIQVRRIVSAATELDTPDWTTPVCEIADRLDLEQPPRVVMSDRIEMAFACRALDPTIVLPATAASWTDDRRRAVLFHELAHVKRHDLVAHALSRVACALYWFHPLVWKAAKQLRAESERACDDLVLSCGARASEYAQHLLDMVTSVRRHGAPVMALPMARKKEFEGRMLAILDPAIRRSAPGRVRAATVVATLGALSITIAAAAPATAHSVNHETLMSTTAVRDTDPAPPRTSRRHPDAIVDTRDLAADLTRDVVGAAIEGTIAQADQSANAVTNRVISHQTNQVTRSAERFANDIATEMSRAFGVAPAAVQRGDTARIALLIKVLGTDSDASVRRSAAWALKDIDAPSVRAALAKALASDNDTEVREMAAWSLSEFGSDEALDALAKAVLRDKSSTVRGTSAWGLAQHNRRRDTDALVSAISDADPEVRETAIWALGQSDLHRAPTALINALSDNNPEIRSTAAWTLGQMGDTAAVRALTRAYESESDTALKTMYLWSLASIGTVPSSVLETAMKSSDPEVRRLAVTMLAGGGSGAWPMPMPRPRPRPTP